LMDIQKKYHLIDIFDDLDESTNSPFTQMSSKSIIKQSAGYNNDNSKYYKFTTKIINNVSKNIYKVRGKPQQYVKDKHKYYILKEYRNMIKTKKSKKT